MAYPKHAEKAAAKRGTVSTKEFAKAAGTAAVAAASMTPAAKALKAAKWALKAAKKAGNAKKVASLEKKVSLLSKKKNPKTKSARAALPQFSKNPIHRYHRQTSKRGDTAKKLKEAQAKEQKFWEDRGFYRPPRTVEEAARGGGSK